MFTKKFLLTSFCSVAFLSVWTLTTGAQTTQPKGTGTGTGAGTPKTGGGTGNPKTGGKGTGNTGGTNTGGGNTGGNPGTVPTPPVTPRPRPIGRDYASQQLRTAEIFQQNNALTEAMAASVVRPNPFATPISPFSNPFSSPFSSPFNNPFSSPFSNPFSNPFANQFNNPFANPFNNPFNNPFSNPFNNPFGNQFSNPWAMNTNPFGMPGVYNPYQTQFTPPGVFGPGAFNPGFQQPGLFGGPAFFRPGF